MTKEIVRMLEEYGLKNKGAQIFTFLVGKKELTAYEIAKNLRLFRSTTYEALEKLIEKGFVRKMESEKITHYATNEISSIVSLLRTKEDILNNLVPKLNKLKSKKPRTRILEGETGQKQYNFELVNRIKQKHIKEIYMIGNSPPETESANIFIEKIVKEIKKERPKKYGTYKGLWSPKHKNSKFIKLYRTFGENKFLSGIPFNVTTFIANNFVGFFFTENEIPYVIEIESERIAAEMKSYFENLWRIAKT